MGVAGVTIYLTTVHNAKSPWQTAGTRVQDVSRSSGIQTEVAVAVDPSRPSNLVAAANETVEPEIRVLTSVNGGRTWSTKAGPMFNRNTCSWGDPAVAIAPNGRQYVAFTEKSICTPGPDLTPYLIVASRSGPRGSWLIRRVARPATKFGYDDKPALTVDSKGRVYVAWSRLLKSRYQTTVVSSSADGGKTWSEPRVVDNSLVQPQLVTIAAAGQGEDLYVAGIDARNGLWHGRGRCAKRAVDRPVDRRGSPLRSSPGGAPAGEHRRHLHRLRQVRPPATGRALPRSESDARRLKGACLPHLRSPRCRHDAGRRRRRLGPGPAPALARPSRPGRPEEVRSVLARLGGRSGDFGSVGVLLRHPW